MLFVKQSTNYTCVPAALLSMANFLNIDLASDELSLANELNCTESGTTLKSMSDFALKKMNAISFGSNTWNGKSPMLAVIHDDRLQIGLRTHAVLILFVKDGYYLKYCPFFGDLTFIHKEEFDTTFMSENGEYKNWSINWSE